MRSASPTAWAAAGSSAPARSRTRTGSTSAPRPAKCATPIDAQRSKTSSPSGNDAVGRTATRGRATPVDARRPASTSAMAGRNSPAPTSATGPGIPRESICETASMTPRQRWTLVATVIGSGSVFLDGTIVNVALPSIGRELPSTVFGVLEGQTYVVSGYLGVLAALLILAGALSDHYGRRRVYALGLTSFAATSALCGFAPTLEWLVVFRLLVGPVVGGLLVDTIGWRVAFLVNVPVLAFALWVVARHVVESRDTGSARK